jgi:hypothetical protein
MQSTFGFLLQTQVYTVELPDGTSPDFELACTVGFSPAAPLGIHVAPSQRADFDSFGWAHQFQASVGDSVVDVYHSPADPAASMPSWQVGKYTCWSQIRPGDTSSRSKVLGDYIAGLQFSTDSFGIPRLRLRGGIVPGNPFTQPGNRDQAVYLFPGTTNTLVLRFDEGLASDGGLVDGNFISVVVGTKFGITVLLSGDVANQADVEATANSIANSLQLVRL